MVVDSVGQGGYDWELDRYGFFSLGSVVLGDSINEEWEASFMVFAVERGLIPSLERSFHQEI
jgi:hypothetical protein